MVEGNTQVIQNAIEDFRPDEKIYFSVGNSTFDAVYEEKPKVGYAQAFADIDHAV